MFKQNFNMMKFKIIDIKNSNVKIFMKYHIDDTTTTSSSFTKFFFEFENFLKKEDATQTYEKKQKKEKNAKKNENESFEKTKKKKTNE